MTSIETLRAVHHPVRRRIIEFLGVHGPSQVTTLARTFDEQVGSVSHHLRMLQRADVVEQAPELATDGRTSWWRLTPERSEGTLSWSVDDFEDNTAERIQAKTAEKLNAEYQFTKLAAWKRTADRTDRNWRAAAFSNDTATLATADELAELQELLHATTKEWADRIDKDDGQERRPVFVFMHGFPTEP